MSTPTEVSADQSKNLTLKFRKGEGRTISFQFLLAAVAYDISEWTFVFEVFNIDGALVFQLTEDTGGGLTNGGATGILTVDPTDDDVDIDPTAYHWKLRITEPSSIKQTLFNGLFPVNDSPQATTGEDSANVTLDLGDIVVEVNLTVAGGSGASTAEDVSFTPSGNIEAEDVQAAIEELDAAISAVEVGAPEWGAIEGTLADQTDLQNALNAKAAASSLTSHTSDTSNPHSVTATQVGLGNVDNTSDASKPVSTAQQTALDLKASIASVIGLQDLYIGAVAMWPRTTSGCAALAKTELATSVLNIQSLGFDQTTQEFAQFTIVLPRNWNNGTVTVKVYWTAASGTASETVQWGISGGAYSNDDALTVALGTAVTVSDAFIAANDLHVTDYTSAITLAGSPADADFLAFQISRNPGSDTLAADAKLLGVVVTLTTDSGVAA